MKTLEIRISVSSREVDNFATALDQFYAVANTMKGKVIFEIIDNDKITMDRIHEAVSIITKIPKDVIISKTRIRQIAEARQIGMFLTKEMIKPVPSLAKIGGYWGDKDHATVLHACRTVQNLIDTEKQFKEKVENIRNSL